jgi:aminoglycoside phosphotransferase family enzyme
MCGRCSNPRLTPSVPRASDLMQTQMSFVFLTGQYAYKTKKPVNLGNLDYTTREQSMHFCDQELALNRPITL